MFEASEGLRSLCTLSFSEHARSAGIETRRCAGSVLERAENPKVLGQQRQTSTKDGAASKGPGENRSYHTNGMCDKKKNQQHLAMPDVRICVDVKAVPSHFHQITTGVARSLLVDRAPENPRHEV